MLEYGGAIEYLHGYALARLRVLRELHLGEGALADRPPDLVPPDLPDHHRLPPPRSG